MVTLEVFQGEPMARLAAQRLAQEGIDCAVRPVGPGPGGWGLAANLPYAVDVRQGDAERAREVLELPPGEMSGPVGGGATRRTTGLLLLVVLALLVAVSVADALFERLFSR